MAGKVKFSKGSVIFKEGAFELSMFFIVSGKVGIYSDYGDKNEKLRLTSLVNTIAKKTPHCFYGRSILYSKKGVS